MGRPREPLRKGRRALGRKGPTLPHQVSAQNQGGRSHDSLWEDGRPVRGGLPPQGGPCQGFRLPRAVRPHGHAGRNCWASGL